MSSDPKRALVLFYNRRHNPLVARWLARKYGCAVEVALIDLGEVREAAAIERESLEAGAAKVHYIDARTEFCEAFLARAVKTHAAYEGKYLLSAALARPMIATQAFRLAREIGADVIVHGFRGNDQVRVDMALAALGEIPSLPALREWDVSDADIRSYAQTHGIPEEPGTNNPYSVSENVWGKSTECGPLENAAAEPPREIFSYVSPPERAPDAPGRVIVGFERGVPVSLDGRRSSFLSILLRLNALGAEHGVGVFDLVEDGMVGLKSRAVYENPGAHCLIEAHRDLERFVCNRHENRFKPLLELEWSRLVYEGLWFDPLMDHLNAFVDSLNERVAGEVELKLFKGSAIVTGRRSSASAYEAAQSIYNFGHLFGRDDAAGFGRVHNLHTLAAARRKRVTP